MDSVFENIIVDFSDRRRSIAIIVRPDLTIRVLAPKKTTQAAIRKVLNQKEGWITAKLEHFRNAKHLTSRFLFVHEGQGFYYIGNRFTIHITKEDNKIVTLGDCILNIHSSPVKAHIVLNRWMESNALALFSKRLEICFAAFSKEFNYRFPQLKIRRMKRRWGSMSSSGVMVLNLCLISVPLECIDYVIMHELCHMKYHNHGVRFHRLQEYFTPNYREVKKRLEEFILT